MNIDPTVASQEAFSIDSIKEWMDSFDPASLLPELSEVFSDMNKVCRICVLIGPILLLLLGLVYLFLTPREANHLIGYRTWFGMGSVEAWRFTQRLAGLVFSGLGVVLGIIMVIVSLGFGKLEAGDLVWKTVRCLLWEAGLSLAAVVGLNIAAMAFFDANGELRRRPVKRR